MGGGLSGEGSDPEKSLVYGKPNRRLAETFVKISGQVFAFDPTQWLSSLGEDGDDNIRTLTDGDKVVAGLVFHKTAQWFGGSRFLSHAIASVFSVAELRQQRLGHRVMLHGLQEIRAAGVPLAVLFASTPAFYRGLGFEPAGHRLFWRAPMHQLPTETHGAQFMTSGPHERPLLHALYARYAQGGAGLIDRTEHFWRYHLNPYDGSTLYTYRIEFDGAFEGYVTLKHGQPNRTLMVQDAVATTPRSAQALMAFLAHHRSVADFVVFPDAPQGALRKCIADNSARIEPPGLEWLLRLVNVPAALEQRGYPPLDAKFELEIEDAVMPENAGRYVLEIAAGKAKVQAGGEGRLRLDVRGLTALFSGFMHPSELAATGLLQGLAQDLAQALPLLGAVFSGPQPTLLDSF